MKKKVVFVATLPPNYVLLLGLSPWGYSPGIACARACVCVCVFTPPR